MPHDTPLITTIVAGLVLAFIFGALANRLKMPPLVGYLVAGVAVGPFTPGFVADAEIAGELSEIGVILLMFGVGLHFSLKDLISVQAVAVPGALLRIAGGTAMGVGLALLMGWSLGGGLVFGLALSVASTVVLLKALQDRHLVESERGRIAVGWVIVEDIAMVLALVLVPAFSSVLGGHSVDLHDPFVTLVERFSGITLDIWGVLGVTVVKLAAFVGFMLVVGRRVIPWILHLTAHTGSRELFRLAVLAIALGVAAGAAYLFGVSLALGAFFAGMILSESELSNRAAQESLPFRDAFSVLFFVSVGMLFNPSILWTRPFEVLGTLFIILAGKGAIGYLLIVLFRRSAGTALTISASLAQVGEFSFILAALGVSLGLMPAEGQTLILAGSIISIIVNPVLVYAAEHFRPQLDGAAVAKTVTVSPKRTEPALSSVAAAPAAPVPAPDDEQRPTRLKGHTVVIGYGRVGTVVADGLERQGSPFVVIEDSESRVAAAREAGIEVIVGNAATPRSLALANVAAAKTVLIAIPNAFEAGQAVEQCHKLNPNLLIVARAHSDEEVGYLRDLGADEVIMGEREIGMGMLNWTTGTRESDIAQERVQAGLDAVAAALKLDPVIARSTVAEPTMMVDAPASEPTFGSAPIPDVAESLPPEPELPVLEPEPVIEVAEAPPAAPRPPPGLEETLALFERTPIAPAPVAPAAPPASVEAPQLAAPPEDPVTLEAAIEAAHPEHEPAGPAEPLGLVPAFGETPPPELQDFFADVSRAPAAAAPAPEAADPPPPAEPEPVEELPGWPDVPFRAQPVAIVTAEPGVETRPRPRRPAATPGTPFAADE